MSDYQKLVKDEAKAFWGSASEEFSDDSSEFGGKSENPNVAKWIDRQGALSERVREISSKWTHKDLLWVQNNTRNRMGKGGGDLAGNAFGSFLKDLHHEVKKLAKKS